MKDQIPGPASIPTLQDLFAGMAMMALIMHYGDKDEIRDADGAIDLHCAAYHHADMMLRARQ